TRGVLTSYDGFVRNLDAADDTDFACTLFGRQEQTTVPAAVMQYRGPLSIVYLRSYPVTNLDQRRFYALATGEIRAPYLDIADGLPKNAIDGLASYSETAGCAEVLLSVLPSYVGGQFSEDELLALTDDGIDSVWCMDGVVYHTSDELRLAELYQSEDMVYTTEQVK
ncbi:MAG: hypothetical protein J6I98_02660, partial [Clostridia bacterium]|nr:hypothetical protein [Clostridia bacterium]